ncbi:MAG: hypothetical protein BWY56_01796 [Acidobacteria bacterium ADurb.Bin340]|nr:MAG: hypothetical protein BWY56_01796 [Acidobacteria bacterium ADurb.Bin340]
MLTLQPLLRPFPEEYPMTKPAPKPLLAGFNWAETVKKAEQEGTSAKNGSAPAPSSCSSKTEHKAGSLKHSKATHASQQRLRVKV